MNMEGFYIMAAGKRGRLVGTTNANKVSPQTPQVVVQFPDQDLLDQITEFARVEERTIPATIRYLCRKAMIERKAENTPQ
jgi:hypothetical protein